MKKQIVIIGGCVAAKEAANAIRSIDSACTITIISQENCLPYYRPMLSHAIGHEIPDAKFCLVPEEWYDDKNIKLLLGTTVSQILVAENAVITSDGDRYEYTQLLIATGASNFIPIPEAMSLEGVFSIRSYDDVRKMRSQLPSVKKVIIIGSGLLGLEAAWEFRQQNIEVTILELASHVLPRQLDDEGAEFFSRFLDAHNITVSCDNPIKDVVGTNRVEGVECCNGDFFPCDMLLFSIGARPNTQLVQGTNIAIDKGIIVNEFMQTNIPNVYAAGDVAQNSYNTSGIWLSAMEMGKTAGYNMAGKETPYTPSKISTMLNAFGIKVFSLGEVRVDESITTETVVDEENKNFRKLFFKNNLLVGAILIGDISKGMKLSKGLGSLTLEEIKKIIV